MSNPSFPLFETALLAMSKEAAQDSLANFGVPGQREFGFSPFGNPPIPGIPESVREELLAKLAPPAPIAAEPKLEPAVLEPTVVRAPGSSKGFEGRIIPGLTSQSFDAKSPNPFKDPDSKGMDKQIGATLDKHLNRKSPELKAQAEVDAAMARHFNPPAPSTAGGGGGESTAPQSGMWDSIKNWAADNKGGLMLGAGIGIPALALMAYASRKRRKEEEEKAKLAVT